MARGGRTGSAISTTRAARGNSTRQSNSVTSGNSKRASSLRSAKKKDGRDDDVDIAGENKKQMQYQSTKARGFDREKDDDYRNRLRGETSSKSVNGELSSFSGSTRRAACPTFGVRAGVGARLPTITVCDQNGVALGGEPPEDPAANNGFRHENEARPGNHVAKPVTNAVNSSTTTVLAMSMLKSNGRDSDALHQRENEWRARQKNATKLSPNSEVDARRRANRLAEKHRVERFLKIHEHAIETRAKPEQSTETTYRNAVRNREKLKKLRNESDKDGNGGIHPVGKRLSKHGSLIGLNQGQYANRRIHSQLISDRERASFFRSTDFVDMLKRLHDDEKRQNEYYREQRTRNSILRRVFTSCFRKQNKD